jgi:hypothetical protein
VDGPGEVRVVWDDGPMGSSPTVGNRCRVLSAVPAATAVILLSGCGNGDGAPEGDAPPATPGETTAAPEDGSGSDQQAGVDFADQAGDGSSAVVDTVSAPQGGFVVVSTGDGAVLGATLVPVGTTDDVVVPLAPALTQGAALTAALYADTDGSGAFDPAADIHVVDDAAEYNLG